MHPMRLIPLLVFLSFPHALPAAEAGKESRMVATVDADGVQRVTVKAGSFFFEPNVIVVKARVPVELTIAREAGVTPHNFLLKAPAASIDISRDLEEAPSKILFTASQTGTYPFACNKKLLFFPSHREKGMVGRLEVVE